MTASTRRRWMLATTVVGLGIVAVDNWPRGGQAAPAAARELSQLVVAPARAATSALPLAAEDRLDTALIAARTTAPPPGDDAFAAKSWLRPPPPAPPPPPQVAPPPPPPAQAPPLPFKLLGRLDETPQKTVWYLGDGERLVLASPGETVDSAWRFDSADGGQLRFTYLPLNLQQQLTIGAPP